MPGRSSAPALSQARSREPARETRQGGILSFWSRGARSSFASGEEALSLSGDVRTAMFGADYANGPLVTGLSLSNSRGRTGGFGRNRPLPVAGGTDGTTGSATASGCSTRSV